MTWTTERSDLAVARWKDGWSAAQIAKSLGGVTRNAVIGRIHRLGLSVRSEASAPRSTARRAAPRVSKPVYVAPSVSATPPLVMKDDEPGLATVLTLEAHMCKWPIGDPADDSFTFCGRRKERAGYCAGHAERAFAPPSKRRTTTELIRSTRRYA